MLFCKEHLAKNLNFLLAWRGADAKPKLLLKDISIKGQLLILIYTNLKKEKTKWQ